MKLLLPLVLLLAAVSTQAQNVRLQLVDHVVGSEILHNAVLPAGTEVWIVPRAETRAMRLRGGYSEVATAMREAYRDRVEQGGYTEKSYPTTARARQAYFVVARLPDGRLFQSYVKTGDAGMQPGFDAVQGGRISMGRVPESARDALAATLTARLPEPPNLPDAAAAQDAEAEPDDEAERVPANTSEALDLPPFPDTTLFLSDSALANAARPVPMQEVEDAELAGPAEPADQSAGRGWLWFLIGLAVGGGAAYMGAAYHYERLLRRQRENMLRYVPLPETEAPAEAREDDEPA